MKQLVDTRAEENKRHKPKTAPDKPNIDKPVIYRK